MEFGESKDIRAVGTRLQRPRFLHRFRTRFPRLPRGLQGTSAISERERGLSRGAQPAAGRGDQAARADRGGGGETPRAALGRRGAVGLRVRTHRRRLHAAEGEDVKTVRAARHADPLQLHVRPRARLPVSRLHASIGRHRRRRAAPHSARRVSCRRQIADRAADGVRAPARLAAPVAALDRGQLLRRRLFRRHHQVLESHAGAAQGAGRPELGRDDLQRLQEAQRKNPSLLGFGNGLRSVRAGPAPPRRRSRRSLVEFARHDAGGTRGDVVSEGGVLGAKRRARTSHDSFVMKLYRSSRKSASKSRQ